MSKKKKRSSGRKVSPPVPPKLGARMQEVEELVRRNRWAEAREMLKVLEGRYPKQDLVLRALADVLDRLGEHRAYEAVCWRLATLVPNEAKVTLALAHAYVVNGRLFLAMETMRRFLAHW